VARKFYLFRATSRYVMPAGAWTGHIHKPLIFTPFYNLLQVFTAFYIKQKNNCRRPLAEQ
jgi:hypothetical protein